MLKLSRMRRSIAMATATLALAGGMTITTAGAAHADGQKCSGWRSAPSNSSAHGWSENECLYHGGGRIDAWVETTSASNSTDVRVWWTLWNKCTNATYTGSSWLPSGSSALPNPQRSDDGCGTWGFDAWLTESGTTYIQPGFIYA